MKRLKIYLFILFISFLGLSIGEDVFISTIDSSGIYNSEQDKGDNFSLLQRNDISVLDVSNTAKLADVFKNQSYTVPSSRENISYKRNNGFFSYRFLCGTQHSILTHKSLFCDACQKYTYTALLGKDYYIFAIHHIII